MRGKIRYIDAEKALEKMWSSVDVRSAAEVYPTVEAYRRVLAQDVVISVDVPKVDSSHRDGYAIRSGDTQNVSRDHPVVLTMRVMRVD